MRSTFSRTFFPAAILLLIRKAKKSRKKAHPKEAPPTSTDETP